MTVTICDRCGAKIEIFLGGATIAINGSAREADLCHKCYCEFKKFMRGAKLHEPDTEDPTEDPYPARE